MKLMMAAEVKVGMELVSGGKVLTVDPGTRSGFDLRWVVTTVEGIKYLSPHDRVLVK